MEQIADMKWVEIKDQTWPDRESSTLQGLLQYPVYDKEDWYLELDRKD